MNAHASVYAGVQARHPGAEVIEHWLDDDPDFGPYRENDGEGGNARYSNGGLLSRGIPA